ncbi:MAG: flagellar hook protein FlgE [Nevskia sp.]|nr:flagellar hook protein FlgE [Nevskia sp.]
MSFDIALSGISAASTDLNTISNNIANADTTGFKQSRAEFGDFFQNAAYNLQSTTTGTGVGVETIAQQFSQGSVTNTSNPLDMAISGQGFFTLKENGALVYTRNGAFTTDSNGYVVSATGQRLQVFPPVAGTSTFSTGTLTDLQISAAPNPPLATSTIGAGINLPANASAPATATFSPTDSTSYNQTTSVTTYDSLGAAHTTGLYFVAGAAPGSWTVHTVVDGAEQGTGTALTFGTAGTLTAPANGQVPLTFTPANGAAVMNMTIDLGAATEYGSTFSVNSLTQNGYTTGQLSGVSIGANGVVTANYTNGQTAALGQVAMANFANPQGLQQLGNATWSQTLASGTALAGAAGTSDIGVVQSGALESSNVDLTQQLVQMLSAQRNYQANSQVISTEDQNLQAILHLQ